MPRFTPINTDVLQDTETGLCWFADGSNPPIGNNPGGRKPWCGPLLAPPPELPTLGTGRYGPVEGYQFPNNPNSYPALDYIDAMNAAKVGGFEDWRLPNINELASLIEPGIPHNNLWLMEEGFRNIVEACNFWSSTTYHNHRDQAWHTHYTNSGNIHTSNKVWCAHYILPVRGSATGRRPVFATGQTLCYGPEIMPTMLPGASGRGQDGDLQRGRKDRSALLKRVELDVELDKFTHAISDSFLGIEWSEVATANVPYANVNALVAAANATPNRGGPQWRPPSFREAQALMTFGSGNPLTSAHGGLFAQIPVGFCWLSTVSANNPANSWFYHPAMGMYTKVTANETAHLWLCRDIAGTDQDDPAL